MEVEITDAQQLLAINHASVVAAVTEVLALEGVRTDVVEVYFVEEAEMCQLHADHFDDPSPTDTISFPMDAPGDPSSPHILGSVFVAPSAAITCAAAEGGDPHTEALLYMVHGLLHLMGYDDIEDADRLEMRAAESRHMKHLSSKRIALNSSRE